MNIIDQVSKDGVIDLCLDTIRLKKQGIVFVSTKKSAEACAEKISLKLLADEKSVFLGDQVENVLSSPTKQCLRLGKVLRKGVAFHHSGLNQEQRRIVEDGFRNGLIKIICSTTTLGAGLDLPAFRTIIRDLKRFSPGWGSVFIPVLEYEQMAGRAGRPSFDKFGEAICIANSNEEKELFWEEYINGVPEEISSKLGVEPVLRIYVLSLVASGYANSFKELINFLANTFYAFQYKNLDKLEFIVAQVISSLEEYGFVSSSNTSSYFKSVLDSDFRIRATILGKRVSDLYLDPLTANDLIKGMKLASEKVSVFSILNLICNANEMRPLFSPRKKDAELIESKLLEEDFLTDVPSAFSDYYYEFAASVKTAIVLEEWMNEKTEDFLFDTYNTAPGELNAKIDRANWLLYSCQELSKLVPEIRKENLDLYVIRERLIKGIKEELLPLIKFKGIGRVRARKLYSNRIRNVKDIKNVDLATLVDLLGKAIALDIKKQVGQDLRDEKIVTKKNKRKGQISLSDFHKD